jgi:pyruvate/2-oxoglutarate dehydrogenase complex dihydrolipoamide dehydrogenase (E3) component
LCGIVLCRARRSAIDETALALLTPDICVIGASPGGASLAIAATAFGASVVLVDNGEFAAGPPFDRHAALAALSASGARAEGMRAAGRLGIESVEPSVDFRAVMRHVARVSAAAARSGSPERLAAAGVMVVRSAARFRDPRTLVAGEAEIRARRFVIATGSSAVQPALPGIGNVEPLDLCALSALTRRPGHLLVLGGGPAAVAAAQAMRRLGSAVTLVADAVLPDFDQELVALLRTHLSADGVDLVETAKITGVERRGKSGLRVHLQSGYRLWRIDPSHFLLAGEDVPDVAGLDLAAAGVAFDGRIVAADARLVTANRHIYVLGDALGSSSPQRTAQQVGLLLKTVLLRRSGEEDAAGAPRLVLTGPELAAVGLSEQEARAKAGRIRILRAAFAENARASAEGAAEGHVKVIADGRGRILGAAILGPGAGDAIGVWSLALARRMTLADMAAWSPAAPTFGEIGKTAAVPYLAEAARRPGVRRLIRFLRAFG